MSCSLPLRDDVTLALAYQAAEVFVCPSTEDTGPRMIPEAVLCERPVVALNSGGAPDLVEPLRTGCLAIYEGSCDLAKGFLGVLTSPHLPSMRTAAHEVAHERYSQQRVVANTCELYQTLKDMSHEGKGTLPAP